MCVLVTKPHSMGTVNIWFMAIKTQWIELNWIILDLYLCLSLSHCPWRGTVDAEINQAPSLLKIQSWRKFQYRRFLLSWLIQFFGGSGVGVMILSLSHGCAGKNMTSATWAHYKRRPLLGYSFVTLLSLRYFWSILSFQKSTCKLKSFCQYEDDKILSLVIFFFNQCEHDYVSTPELSLSRALFLSCNFFSQCEHDYVSTLELSFSCNFFTALSFSVIKKKSVWTSLCFHTWTLSPPPRSLCLSLPLSLPLCLSVSLSLSPSFSLPLSLSLLLSLSLSVSVCVYVCVLVCMCVCMC